MKTTKKFYYYAFALLGSTLMLFSSCEKEDEKNVPVLTTTEVTEITQTTATSGGNISDDGGTTVTARGVCWSTSQNPAINNSKTEDGNGAGSFTSSISGLKPNTTYYVRAYATNSAGTGYGSTMSFTTLEEVTGAVDADGNVYSTVVTGVDADGNVYSTVVIGNQVWFAENLKTTKYNNGTPIPNVTSNSDWGNLTSGAYAWYENNEGIYKNAYGALYNWYAVNTGNLCPTGWRVPTDAEWTTLTAYAGGESVAGGKLKSTRTAPDAHPRWDSPNTGATDEYGFSALPGGSRGNDGAFDVVGYYGDWWSSTEYSSSSAWGRYMSFGYSDVFRYSVSNQLGFVVRCLKDL